MAAIHFDLYPIDPCSSIGNPVTSTAHAREIKFHRVHTEVKSNSPCVVILFSCKQKLIEDADPLSELANYTRLESS